MLYIQQLEKDITFSFLFCSGISDFLLKALKYPFLAAFLFVVTARIGDENFRALLFELVSGSSLLLVFMTQDASNESMFS